MPGLRITDRNRLFGHLVTPALLLAGCAQPGIAVVTHGDRAPLPATLAADASNPGLASRLIGQGVAKAAPAAKTAPLPAIVVQIAATTRSDRLGVCTQPGADAASPCKQWAAAPARGWKPFGRPIVHQLALRFSNPATGETVYEVVATTARRGGDPLVIRNQLLDAAIACSGCAGGALGQK